MRDGIVLLDKPRGISSNQAARHVQRLLGAKKAGHTGTLDPMATGMLPVCLGEATKIVPYLIDRTKCYTTTVQLGIQTDTGDAEGAAIQTRPVPSLDFERASRCVADLLGRSMQVPPMYSALKKDGIPLYSLARQGKTVDREPRAIEVLDAHLLQVGQNSVSISVVVSKGTYVRELGERLARALGTVGHLSKLRRDWVSPFESEPMCLAESIQAAPAGVKVLTVAEVMRELPAIQCDSNLLRRMTQGLPTQLAAVGFSGQCRLQTSPGKTHAIVCLDEQAVLRPLRVFLREI